MDEARLVAMALAGEAPAFRALYEEHRPAVVRLVEAFGGLDADEVADVVQETFARAFSGLPRLREPAQFRAWVLTIARNRCLSFSQSRGGERRALSALAHLPEESEEPPPSLKLAQEEERKMVRELIDSMDEGVEKRTAILFYIEGELSVRQIAERYGETKSAVAMRLERSRSRFKLRLLAHLGEPAAEPEQPTPAEARP
jgi:RNA polymerase sigma-70 factor (ECF subfamily)